MGRYSHATPGHFVVLPIPELGMSEYSYFVTPTLFFGARDLLLSHWCGVKCLGSLRGDIARGIHHVGDAISES